MYYSIYCTITQCIILYYMCSSRKGYNSSVSVSRSFLMFSFVSECQNITLSLEWTAI